MPRFFKSSNFQGSIPGPSDPSKRPFYDFIYASVLLPPLDYGIPEGTDLGQCWASLFSPHAVFTGGFEQAAIFIPILLEKK